MFVCTQSWIHIINITYTYSCVWWNGKLQSNHNETMAIEAIVHFFSASMIIVYMSKCSLFYRLYEQERTSLNALEHSPSYANVTSSCPALCSTTILVFHVSIPSTKWSFEGTEVSSTARLMDIFQSRFQVDGYLNKICPQSRHLPTKMPGMTNNSSTRLYLYLCFELIFSPPPTQLLARFWCLNCLFLIMNVSWWLLVFRPGPFST